MLEKLVHDELMSAFGILGNNRLILLAFFFCKTPKQSDNKATLEIINAVCLSLQHHQRKK